MSSSKSNSDPLTGSGLRWCRIWTRVGGTDSQPSLLETRIPCDHPPSQPHKERWSSNWAPKKKSPRSPRAQKKSPSIRNQSWTSDDRPHPSIDEDMKRSVQIGEDEASAEVENWPRVNITGKPQRMQGTASVSVSTEETEDGRVSPAPKSKTRTGTRGKKKRSKAKRGRKESQKIVFSMEAGKVKIQINIQVPKAKRASKKRGSVTASED